MKKKISPDSKQLKEENLLLKKEVSRKAIDLDEKNQELALEASLEVIREVAMAMNKPEDMLVICQAISGELQKLGVTEIRNIQTAIIDKGKEVYYNYEYFRKGKKKFITEVAFKKQKDVQAFVNRMAKDPDGFFTRTFKGAKLKQWIRYQASAGQYIDPGTKTTSSLHYYFYSIGPGALGISSYAPLSSNVIGMFKRFRNVFKLAYSRYLAIEQALETAREANIQASLEKIRATAMAMNKPEDILTVCETMYREFQSLGFPSLRNAMINIHNDEKRSFINYDYSHELGKSTNHLRYDIHPVIQKQVRQMRKSDDAFSETVFEGKDLASWKKFRKEIGEKDDARIKKAKGLYYYFYSIGTGSIGISTFEPIKEERLQLLKRFRNVFHLSYQRYADVKQAEEQAREAQIELGLEKIRARAMAMQRSEELAELVDSVFRELTKLGFVLDRCLIMIYDKVTKGSTWWLSSEQGAAGMRGLYVDHHPNEVYELYLKKWREREEKWQYGLEGKIKKSWDNYIFKYTELSLLPDPVKAAMRSLQRIYLNVSFNSFGSLTFSSFEPLGENEFDILLRFAKVFDQTYTRFLDLQRAEEQAWEAQIEAAMERVRSRSMAMQRSEELLEVATVLFQQVKALGVPQWNCGFNIWNIGDDKFTYYPGSPVGIISPSPCKIPLNEHPVFMRFDESRKRGDELLIYEKKGEEQASHYKYMLSLPGVGDLLQIMLDAGFELPKFQIDHLANFAYGNLIFITYEHFPKMHDVFKRFAKVFEQTYTRFLDLQKAEAQAREARIETALEAVRTSSMAMHQSDQLQKVVTTLSNKLIELKVSFDGALIFFFDKEKRNCNVWISTTQLPEPVKINIPSETEIPGNEILDNLWKAIDTGEDFINQTYWGKTKNDYFRCVAKKNIGKVPAFVTKMQVKAPSWTISFAPGNNSVIGIDSWSGETLALEDFQVLKRFGLVFEQAYTRFLDLQKAEAQSREAEIQLALERVRSRSLAMHHTSELQEVVGIVAQQLHAMNIDINGGVFITINDEVDKDIPLWASAGAADYVQKVVTPFLNKPFYKRLAEALKKRNGFYTEELSRKEKVQLFEHLFQFSPWSNLSAERKADLLGREGGLCRSIAINQYTSIAMTDHFGRKFTREENDILIRFGNVLEQSYTRFLDLQKAEAQARKSQIELGLERVRTRAMAMQNSDELKELIGTVFTELTKLDLALTRCIIWVFDPATSAARWWMANSEEPSNPMSFYVKYHEHPAYLTFVNAWKEQNVKFVYDLNGKDKIEWDNFIFKETELKNLPAIVKKGMKAPDRVLLSASFNNFGGINVASLEPLSEAHFDILLRFAKVFDLTYTRFNDLIRAEEQTREAKIESALERIRARALAMHESGELIEVAKVLREQMGLLGQPELETSAVQLYEEDPENIISFRAFRLSSDREGEIIYSRSLIPKACCVLVKEMLQHFYAAESDFTVEVSGKKQAEWYKELFKIAPEVEIAMKMNNSIKEKRYYHFSKFSGGALLMAASQVPSRETCQLQKRAARVFDLAYHRFLDLKKAEAQSREAQIEAALERVRSRAMAMHSSAELSNAAMLLYEQLRSVGITEFFNCGYVLVNEEKNIQETWMTDPDGGIRLGHDMPLTGDPVMDDRYKSWKRKDPVFSQQLGGDKLRKHLEFASSLEIAAGNSLPVLPDPTVFYCSHFSHGYLHLLTKNKLNKEAENILSRFSNVFEIAFRRFLDLEKAEAQAREAKIETALEKVRSRTMAMQKSEELADTVWILFEQLKELGEQPERAFIGVINEAENVIEIWATQHGGLLYDKAWKATIDEPYVMSPMYKAWKEHKRSLVIDLKGVSLEGYFQFLKNLGAPVKREIFGERRFENIAFFSKGMLGIITPDEQTSAAIQLYERFASVFDLTYTRFLDLKNAEAQARESRIETSLERVRGKAMAMHSSRDLSETVNVFFGELKSLGITPIRCGVGAIDEKERTSAISATSAQQQGDSYELIGKLKLAGHPVLDNVFQHWKDQKEYFPVLKGKEITEYYRVMKPQVAFPDYPEDATQYGCYFYFKEGIVFAWSEIEFTEDELRIFRRFTTVISLTYRRYIELQKSEAQAKEAVKQASLDRLRAEIASMRTIDDLERITPLIWKELTILGVPFIRCGVFIMDNEQSLMHTFLSTPEGKAIAAFHLPYDTPGNVSQILYNWQQKKIYTDHWDEAAFLDWTQILVQKGAITAQNDYLASFPKGGFFLHFVPFLQGMFYVGNSAELKRSDIKLLQTVADAFSTAYARYEDFNRLEIAKQQVENTLTDLKQAQQQLVQSEKMASLGELTAGIAHEIQNPLNFVNNFSEVSKELLDEMRTELDSGNLEEAKEIANDVIQNLDKINHHGKRADSIVKGMLQHSRSSNGQKEPTDLNALCEEYLRLSFHGLRAKDKTFNSNFNTDLDSGLPRINIIPQDIGRVILNLINNAFYAVSEKRKQAIPGYEPTVTVATSRKEDKVEIRVSDNGMGIPQRSLTKIFQPFYTTKPTGQGTGLGLSLSYDIITKGHNGEIKVETKEGEGTTFIIILPV